MNENINISSNMFYSNKYLKIRKKLMPDMKIDTA